MTSAQGPPPRDGGTDGAAYADRYARETPEIAAARRGAERLTGAPPVSPAVGAALAVLAARVRARSVVAVGSGGGVAGLWLLQGMRADGVLTVLDTDPAHLRAARTAFGAAGVPSSRTRTIFGAAAEVLPRLSPGAYDLVVCDGAPRDWSGQLEELLGLLRPGGTLVAHGLLAGGRIADRAARDPHTVAWRELARAVREREDLLSAVLPVGNGLLVVTAPARPDGPHGGTADRAT